MPYAAMITDIVAHNKESLLLPKITRGGKRKGAGRPRKSDEARLHFACRMKESNRQWIKTESERTGWSMGEIADLAVEVLQKNPEELPADPESEVEVETIEE